MMTLKSATAAMLVLLLSHTGQASQSKAHQSGQSFASSLTGTVVGAAKSTSPNSVPGFVTATPREASLDAHSLGDAALKESSRNEAAQHLTAQAQDRQSFKIDPDSDPLMAGTSRIIANPQKTLGDGFRETASASSATVEETKTCEESGDEYVQSCSKHLKVVLEITPEKGHHTPRYCYGHWKSAFWGTKYWHNGGCMGGNYVIDQPKKVEVISERWIDGCAVLESQVDKGLCRYLSARHSEQETRIIQDRQDPSLSEPVTRDHFDEYYQYACFKPSPKSCASLRGRGCYQLKSVCKQRIGNQCILWEQTYSCKSIGKQRSKSQASTSKENPFCLTGNCADVSYEANNEMMTVISQMAVLREAQNNLRDYKAVFKGTNRGCTRNCINFRDCCGSGKGWGVSIGLSHCDKQERELRTLRDQNRCAMVGTYCAARDPILRTCLRKKTAFCCFGTKLARLIQQSGRGQIGRSWGSPEYPDCNGLSPEELSRMDFSTIDFSELFEDIKSNMVPKDQKQSMARLSQGRLKENMALMARPPGDRQSIQKQQQLKEKGM